MRKELLRRALIGGPIGIMIGTIITIMMSFVIGDGHYYTVVPELIHSCGSELNAFVLQSVVCLLYGAIIASVSLIYEKEEWTLLKRTIIHLLVISAIGYPIAYYLQWMPHSILGFVSYYGLFFGIYVVIWFIQYNLIKHRLSKINKKLSQL